MFEAAHALGWGGEIGQSAARTIIDKAVADEKTSILANRLLLLACRQNRDLDRARSALAALETANTTRIRDYEQVWRLLFEMGRASELREAASAAAEKPVSEHEMLHLARMMFEFGMPDKAQEVLKAFTPSHGRSEYSWLSSVNLLTYQKHWEELQMLALRMGWSNAPCTTR